MREQRVIVSAGAAGIGRAIAQAFLDQGARVFVCDVDEAAIAALDGDNPNLRAARANVANEAEVDQLFENALAWLGGLDVLVNTAGTGGPAAPVETFDLAEWQSCLAVTLDGSFLCCRRAVPAMKAVGGGSIVNFSSTAGLHGYPLRSPYATAKWGIIGFTKSLASEVGPDGIRVNAICPGAVSGDRMDRVIANEARASGRAEDEIRRDYTKGVSLRTFIDPDDIANMALFLSSPAGARVSGQAIPVDGHTETYSLPTD